MEKEKPEVKEYEKPEIIDYGDLVELTAGGSRASDIDQLWPTNSKANKSFC